VRVPLHRWRHASLRASAAKRVDCAAYLVELGGCGRIELGDFEAAPAAFGDEPLPVQQMQRMRHRLARDTELVGELVLPDALAGLKRAVGDRLQDPCIDLVDQVSGAGREGSRWQLQQATQREYEFRIRNYGGQVRASSTTWIPGESSFEGRLSY